MSGGCSITPGDWPVTIEEVINQAIVAIYQSPRLSNLLVLKGGGALRLFDGLDARQSIDADFSTREMIDKDATSVFKDMESCLSKAFGARGYDILDFKATRRPKRIRQGFPQWWGGWACEFKIIDHKHRGKSHEMKRRLALTPEGANSPRIKIDLSEHEFCGKPRTKTVKSTKIYAYSRELLVLEKLRAICQQHPDYPFRQETKNRARDFFDIYSLTPEIDKVFISRCRKNLKPVFEAKEVPLQILDALANDEAFVDGFRRGFDQVKDTVRGRVDDFDVYLEHVKFLIRDINPGGPA